MLLTLIYDGGCPFCREFALRSELQAGVPNLRIVDGRADHTIRRELMNPSDPLLGLLAKLFGDNQRSALAYPALLAARRLALATRGLSVDPDQARSR